MILKRNFSAARAIAWAVGFLATALPTWANEFTLAWPVDCALGETCFLQQYVDHDLGPGAQDYTCGPLSYDTHTGTDIRVADLAAMVELGVDVVAAAPGVVRAIRDGEDDAYLTPERREALAGRGCGNGVVLDHADGWQTQYCHLLKGSVSVARGDQVAVGDRLGEIGLSGFTEFPHLEFIVRKDGEVVDPFAPDTLGKCGAPQTSLWQTTPPYQAGGLLRAGFASEVPEFQAIKEGQARAAQLPSDANALVLWGYVFGARLGDLVKLEILRPDGSTLLTHEAEISRNRAELFRAAGRRLRTNAWGPGRYLGVINLIRDGVEIDRLSTHVTVK